MTNSNTDTRRYAFSPLTGAPSDRAKQFIPFAALRGFYQMVEDASRVHESKKDILPDRLNELNEVFEMLEVGDTVAAMHYENGSYAETIGILQEIDSGARTLKIAGTVLHAQEISELELVKLHD